MIAARSKEDIIAAARIEEVVADFVNLKKRGTNFVGLCPFHTEKTPSFHVSPSKGIYKCFGCGKGGDAVSFIMEHEKFNYPEALRHLANKYNIAIEETGDANKDQGDKMVKDSLFIINQFAQQYYHDNLSKTSEGRNIGLAYLKERGFTDEMKKKFMLGFALSEGDAFMKNALMNGYQHELLKKAGLITQKGNDDIDFFHSRVMFPLLNLSGKVVAFAGRIMGKDERAPKYINSPETEIYQKSALVYGIFQARNAIRKEDECFLTEGYTDVISMHQAAIENVVASSGTSLTPEQVKVIRRFTNNITLLYDGDPAGIKAALRGLEMMTEQDVNVRVVLLPDGEDPDSYLHKNGTAAFKEFIRINKKHFLQFKTALLLTDAGSDPLKKADVIKNIVETLAKIPDTVKRSILIKESSTSLDIGEQVLITEVNKIKRKQFKKETGAPAFEADRLYDDASEEKSPSQRNEAVEKDYYQEAGIIKLLLEYGNLEMEDGQKVIDLVLDEIKEAPLCNHDFQLMIHEMEELFKRGEAVDHHFFINHPEQKFRDITLTVIAFPYHLSENWDKKHEIFITTPQKNYKKDVVSTLHHFKLHKLMNMKLENQQQLKSVKGNAEDETHYMTVNMKLDEWISQLGKSLGTVTLSYFK
ncbi:MAG: DNA primase [Chitinophagales bacterium]|nr:DNA primase [Chitinophagales bacterium]